MTPAEIKELVQTLRACGVTHYKDGALELDLGPEPINRVLEDHESTEIKHKVQALTSLLKLDDKDLVDRLFPDYTQQGEAEESAESS